MIEPLVTLLVVLTVAMIAGCLAFLLLVIRERKVFSDVYFRSCADNNKSVERFLTALNEERQRWAKQQETLSERFVQSIEKVISYAREEHEAGSIALKMAAIIDARVEARTMKVTVDAKTGDVIATPRAPGNSRIPEQPPDPNVRQSGLIDEVHEAERDAERILNPDAEYASRDEREFMG